MPKQARSQPPSPHLSLEGKGDLDIDSTLQELPLYEFSLEVSQLGEELSHAFEKYPALPGAILTEEGQFFGAISRRQFLEYLLLPQGLELFLKQPLQVFYSYARPELAIFPGTAPILTAAQRVLRRSPRRVADPIVVEIDSSTYKLLDFAQLNLAAWQMRGIETQVRYERSQAQMIQSEKMASLGRLVDGLAHEILDPVNFIWGNLTHISNYSKDLLQLLSAYDQFLDPIPTEIVELQEEIESEFLYEDFPKAVESITVGAKRLKHLVESLQNFCHVDDVFPKPADIHACLDGILLLLRSRLKSNIQVTKNYSHLPPVTCYIGKLSQVFMNILTNAVDVLLEDAVSQQLTRDFEQTVSQQTQPRIEITTQMWVSPTSKAGTEERYISIRIVDNGPGLSQKQQRQIRESFAVEKRAEKETSLAMSYQIVTAKHGGQFKLRSQLGTGTEFEILLPLM